VISLVHALSDGPGTLQVTDNFLTYLDQVLSGSELPKSFVQPKADYGAHSNPRNDVYAEVINYREELQQGVQSRKIILPPEALEGLPRETSTSRTNEGCIDCISISLTKQETAALRESCRAPYLLQHWCHGSKCLILEEQRVIIRILNVLYKCP